MTHMVGTSLSGMSWIKMTHMVRYIAYCYVMVLDDTYGQVHRLVVCHGLI
jgi:hypothetical protein